MNEPLHPMHLACARIAILEQFRAMDMPPEGSVHLRVFLDLLTKYRGGYFNAAWEQLMEEGWIAETSRPGVYRLEAKGYEEAHR